MTKEESVKSSSNNANTVLCEGVTVADVAAQYKEQERLEKLYRQEKLERIKELEQLIQSSIHANIYNKIYKAEYGDYREFVEKVAKVLREEPAFAYEKGLPPVGIFSERQTSP